MARTIEAGKRWYGQRLGQRLGSADLSHFLNSTPDVSNPRPQPQQPPKKTEKNRP